MKTPPDRAVSQGGGRPAADSFTVLWRELSDILGTAATATLVRRAARRAAVRSPELGALSIDRENLEYVYTVPSSWNGDSSSPPEGLRDLVRDLCALLFELTGSVVVNRLAQIPELRGIVPRQEERP